jgi:hypothetical protein
MAIEDVRAIPIASKDGPVNQRSEHASADVLA